MYALIEVYREIIVNSIAAMDHVQRYVALKTEFGNPNACADPEFRRRFRHFWRMNAARLPEDWHANFFDVLHDTRDNPTDNIIDVMNRLELGLHGQRRYNAFSFASKLVHMVSNNLPIVDQNVRSFFFLADVHSNETAANQFTFLRQEYTRILEHGLLRESIRSFRERFQVEAAAISDVKVVDSLIWRFVEVMKATPVLNRIIHYG